MRYISEDGKVFNTEEECLDHENKTRNEEARKKEELEQKEKVRKARYAELVELEAKIEADTSKYNALQKEYLETYCDVKVANLGDLFDLMGYRSYGFPFKLFRK